MRIAEVAVGTILIVGAIVICLVSACLCATIVLAFVGIPLYIAGQVVGATGIKLVRKYSE